MLPTDPKARKEVPIASGFMDYFPDAVAEVAALSRGGNEQHNPGKPLQWDRDKSGDEDDALMRHFMERGTFDTDGIRHSAKVAWRAMAMLQKELEKAYGLPLPRGARKSEAAVEQEEERYTITDFGRQLLAESLSAREEFIQETTRTEAPNEGDKGYTVVKLGCLDPYCTSCGVIPQASFPPFVTGQDTTVGSMAGVERSEVVGVLEKRPASEGVEVAPQVRVFGTLKARVFGDEQAPEV